VSDIKAGGLVVFWSASESDRGRLLEGLHRVGWGKFTPEPKTPYHALLDAARAVYGGPEYLHRGTAGRGAVEVVREFKGEGRNEYAHYDTLCVEEKTGLLLECEQWLRVQAEYTKARANLPATAITDLLVQTVYACKGVTLRPAGGFYWVRESETQKLRDVAQVCEQASVRADTKVYLLSVSHDADSVRAIVDALTAEVGAATERIEGEIAEGEIGSRALKTRQEEALALRGKVQELAGILGVGLENLTARLDAVEMAAAKAILGTAAAQQREATPAGQAPVNETGSAALFGAA
jgi:hypothetical protein